MTQPDTRLSVRHSGIHAHSVSSTLEREIKLSVDPDFRLPRLPGTPLPRKILTSTYYDTASYDLAHARITLRYRAEQGKKAWQLKLPLCDDRQEVELVDSIYETGASGPGSPGTLPGLFHRRNLHPRVSQTVGRHPYLTPHM